MCGITGFFDHQSNTSSEIIEKMTNTMVHRGPDSGSTILLDSNDVRIGLGHRRLAIIDLTDHGKQPMQFQNLWITFNGEIYNYKELKAELELLGHSFSSQSDTEMILHAFMEWREKCLDKFIGMFAFVIVDLSTRKVFAARDRAGVKPFVFYKKKNLLLFGSELKTFHQHPNFDKKIDTSAVALFLQYGNIPAPHSIFKDCFKLLPGHYLTYDLSNQQLEIKKYWDVYDAYNQPKLELSFEEAKKETTAILQKAFDYRMVADVPVGVFLSGGYDSVSVTALLQKDRTEKLKTFTIAVPDIGLNEAPYAADVAKHLGTDHTEINCTQQEAIELIPQLPHFYDEPFGDSSAIPTTLVSLMARKHVTVALSADGGDELFAGYNRYDYLMRHGSKIANMPKLARKAIAQTMELLPADKIPVLKNKYNFHNRYEKLKGILRDPSPEKIMQSLSQQYDTTQLKTVLKAPFTVMETAYQSTALRKEFYTPLSYMMAIDYTTYMVDDILQKVDRATMTASLEGREPFMDQHIIEWAAQLPDNFKYHNGIKKHILKEIVHDYVPKSLMDRPKMGFAIPIADWLRNDLRDLLESYLSEDRIKKEGLLNWDYVADLKSKFLHGRKEYDLKIWYLLMFEMWMEKWGTT